MVPKQTGHPFARDAAAASDTVAACGAAAQALASRLSTYSQLTSLSRKFVK